MRVAIQRKGVYDCMRTSRSLRGPSLIQIIRDGWAVLGFEVVQVKEKKEGMIQEKVAELDQKKKEI